VVAVAGNIKHRKVVDLVEQSLSVDCFLAQTKKDYQLRQPSKSKVAGTGKLALLSKKTEQAHIVYSVPGVARDDKSRFALSILSSAIGGGMSSRLFQEIREKRGLAYSTYAYSQQFAGSGVLSFYVGCKPDKAEEAIKII
jgi:predicted Zn-dependent peptidase